MPETPADVIVALACCGRRGKPIAERREHDYLRAQLAKKQEEVKRLENQVAALDARTALDVAQRGAEGVQPSRNT